MQAGKNIIADKVVARILSSGKKNSLFFQPKLSINQPNDVYEQEADAMADKVMRMSDTSHNTFFKPHQTLLQRKCEHCEAEDKNVPRKESSDTTTTPVNTENYIHNLDSGGRPLSGEEKTFFEPRFGYDFSGVRVHNNSEASQTAKNINAQAFTYHNHIVFGSQQYQPNSKEGKHLLAHELTHVVQQQARAAGIQRKIIVGSTELTVDENYKKIVADTFGKTALDIMLTMHKDGKEPEFRFPSWEAYRTELRIRSNAIKGMEEAHNNCCSYPSAHPDGYLDPTYWDKKEINILKQRVRFRQIKMPQMPSRQFSNLALEVSLNA